MTAAAAVAEREETGRNSVVVDDPSSTSRLGSGNVGGGGGGGKCPVDHKNRSTSSSLWKVFGIGGGGGKVDSSSNTSTDASTSNNKSTTGRQLQQHQQPASLEEVAKYAQTPHPEQRLPLSTYRAESSIPRGTSIATSTTTGTTMSPPVHHQVGVESSNNRWVYPSEQQVFNAMKRKGWLGVEEETIPSFLQVHNSVNERSWKQLCDWERTYLRNNNTTIQLVRFEGRPNDISPKAWFKSTFLFEDRPFDRHDWYIDNGTDHEKRYVLDFYMKDEERNNGKNGLPRVVIDVRPALDSPQAFFQRGQRIASDLFPGIAKELERWQQQQQQRRTSNAPTPQQQHQQQHERQ